MMQTWVPAGAASMLRLSVGQAFSMGSMPMKLAATAGQTTFTATYTVGYVQVYVNGVLLNASDYTATSGTAIVLAAAAAAGDIVDVISLAGTANGVGGNIFLADYFGGF